MARRSGRNGSYLGGIGTMVTQLESCPACGHAHEEGLVEYFAGSRTADDLPESSTVTIPTRVMFGQPEIPVVRPLARRTRSPAIPWPMPPVSEVVP